MRPYRFAFSAVLLALPIGACRPSASGVPLSPEAPPAPPARVSSSRAVEGQEDTSARSTTGDGGVIVIAPDDDDDDDDSARVRSTAPGTPPGTASHPENGAKRGVSRKGDAPVAACAFQSGAPLDCAKLGPAGSTCAGANLARRMCETLRDGVDARVGEAWVRCLRDAGPEICDMSRVGKCALEAADAACLDERVTRACTEIETACADFAPEIKRGVCEKLLSALKPEMRSRTEECLRHACDTGSFGSCL